MSGNPKLELDLPGQESQQQSQHHPTNLSQTTEEMLREEIRATQGSQAAILKWKFLAIAAVGAFGLNTAEKQGDTARWLLGLIPLICLYADILLFHFILRVITIGAFIKKSYQELRRRTKETLLDYEGFVFLIRGKRDVASPFGLETIAVVGSSLVIDLLLLVSCLVFAWPRKAQEWALPGSALFCFIVTLIAFSLYQKRFNKILEAPLHEMQNQALNDSPPPALEPSSNST